MLPDGIRDDVAKIVSTNKIDLVDAHAEKAGHHQRPNCRTPGSLTEALTGEKLHAAPHQRRNLNRQLLNAPRPTSRWPAPRPDSGSRGHQPQDRRDTELPNEKR